MAELKLNTSTSVVDFLKSKGKESSFGARRKLFEEGGFEKRLGSFRGSASQNVALLKSLQQSERATPDVPSPTNATDVVQTAQTPQQTPQIPQQQAQPFNLTQIPQAQQPSAQDVLSRARGETSVQFAQEEAQIGKERIAAALPQDLANVKADFASRGLVFSGARTAQEQAVRNQALADTLDIDLRFSKILGSAIDRAVVDLGKDFEQVVEDAQNQQQAEIDFLDKLGLAVNPETGQVVETLQSQRNAAKDEVAAARSSLLNAKTIQDMELARRRINISEATEARLSAGTKGGTLSISELNDLGLPLSLLGRKEEEIVGTLQDAQAPEWFRKQQELAAKQNIAPVTLQKQWSEFQANSRIGASQKTFFSTQFINDVFTPEKLKDEGTTAEGVMTRVEAWRTAGFDDEEILKMMQ